jgi:iron(III) transport system ATP-binding protein
MLTVRSLHKDYLAENGRIVAAARNVSFSVPRGKMFTLLGPSGCGKTTTLRCIAGLEKPSAGEIMVGDEIIYSSKDRVFVPPNKRKFGMVFQSYAIWPHMTVFQNAAFPLEIGPSHKTTKEIDEAVSHALHVVDLDGYEDRRATQLSGGQQQRLALARALVMKPPLLLLDEPLSNLDAKLRERMRFELKRLQNDLGITTIYVTHDQAEALALSHEIAVMFEGEIVQIGSPKDIYGKPKNKFVADFIGTTNLIPGEIVNGDGTQTHTVRMPFGVLSVRSNDQLSVGDAVLVSIRPEHIRLSTSSPVSSHSWKGVVDTTIYLGERQDVQVKVGGVLMQARAPTSVDFSPGNDVYLDFREEDCIACLQ